MTYLKFSLLCRDAAAIVAFCSLATDTIPAFLTVIGAAAVIAVIGLCVLYVHHWGAE